MTIFEAVLLGVIEGVTEFLPVSSTGHLTIAENLLGHSINSPDITAFTAIVQIGAILATVLYFSRDLWRILTAWLRGLFAPAARNADYRFGWAVVLGSLPIGLAGLIFKDQIEGSLRSLWVVAIALISWSFVMWWADRHARQNRHERDITWRDTLIIGLVQCLSLVPGVSRSGATLSAGLVRGLDRVAVTRLSFFLSIPALLAAGTLQAVTQFENISGGVGWGPTLTATAVSFVVAYGVVAWLLKYVARHSFSIFIIYRLLIGTILLILLLTGVVSAT